MTIGVNNVRFVTLVPLSQGLDNVRPWSTACGARRFPVHPRAHIAGHQGRGVAEGALPKLIDAIHRKLVLYQVF